MAYALIGLGGLLALIGIICQIMVLVKLFQTEGAGKGILGLLCSPYLLIWGFMNAGRLNLMKLMLGWIGLTIIGVVLCVIGSTMMGVDLQRQMNMNSSLTVQVQRHLA
ncbi:MAG: hypothetical protein JO360_09180 [Acidobacteria bacterium]|nr:hypothetical protein [Acidobacteriota bacterium]